VLRVVLGTPSGGGEVGEATHFLVEANVDDLTGELAGHAIEVLLGAGALDAWAVPITMKKGRPGLTIAAIAQAASAEAIAAALLRETTSIGVRKTPLTRTERPRRLVELDTPYGRIRVKVSEGPFGAPVTKPEFEDCARAAAQHGVPVRQVLEAVMAA